MTNPKAVAVRSRPGPVLDYDGVGRVRSAHDAFGFPYGPDRLTFP